MPGKFKNALARLFIQAQSLVYGCSHFNSAALTFMCPFREFDFRHQFRLDPMRTPCAFNLFAKWIFVGLQRVQFFPERSMCRSRKATARIANM